MEFSTVPFILLILVAFIGVNASRVKKQNEINSRQLFSIYALLAVLVSWGVLSSYFSLSGIYKTSSFLSLFPGFWLPLVPMVISITAVVMFSTLRTGIVGMIDNTPRQYFVYIHALRILAIGSLLKAYTGDFPVNFAIYVGIPDLLFGLSVLYVGYNKLFSDKFLMVWNVIGALAVTVPAMALFQTGLPGSLQIFTDAPTTEKLLEFPMVIAPTLVVPVFILLNVMLFVRLYAKETTEIPLSEAK